MKKIKKFDFFYDEDTYYIEDYKMILENDEYYLSLDPFNSDKYKNEFDCGIIISESLEIILL